MSELNQFEFNMSELDQSELNMSELNQFELHMSELNQIELNMSELNQFVLNLSELNMFLPGCATDGILNHILLNQVARLTAEKERAGGSAEEQGKEVIRLVFEAHRLVHHSA